MKNNTVQKPMDTPIGIRILLTVLIWAGGLIIIVPFIWMLSTSFKGINEVFTFPIQWIPQNPTLKGYAALFSGSVSYMTFFVNSLKVSALAVAGTFFSCTMAGYAYAKINFTGRNKIFMAKLMTTMIPGMVTMLPTYIIYSKLGLINHQAALWLPYFFGGVFGVFLMRQAFVMIPDALIEAAKIDGANHFRIYWSVALPNVKSTVSALLFMYFLWSWNDYEKPLLYVWDKAKQTLPLAVKLFADSQSQNYPAIMAANVIMLLPIMIFFISAQRFFVMSLTTSGLK